jgi:sugar/nucleoside kinase (ribokinase family)
MAMLVVGSVAQDTIHNHLGTHDHIIGGAAVFCALSGSTFGPVQLVGVVGRDFPQSAMDLLKDKGVDLEGLEIVDGKTFHWEGRYSDDLASRETIRTDLNVFADFRPKIPASYRNTEYLMLANIDPELQLEVLDQVDRPKLVVADTMNLWIDIRLEKLKELLGRIDVLTINEEEARQLSGEHNVVVAAKALHSLGPKTVIIKRGEYGALLFDGGRTFSAPALPLDDVKDPTGCGDTFAGGFIGHLANTPGEGFEHLKNAVIYGSAIASFCVQGIGINNVKDLSRDAVNDRVRTFHELVRFEAN